MTPHSIIEIDTGGRPVQEAWQSVYNKYTQVGYEITRVAMADKNAARIGTACDWFADPEWFSLYQRALKAARMSRWSGGDS